MAGEGCSCSRIVWLATLVVMAGILLFSGEKTVTRAQENCQGNPLGLLKECYEYIKKSGPQIDPSPSCCDIVKDTDIKCVCGKFPPVMAEIISNAKVAYVAQICGNPLPPRFKCVKET